MTSTLDFDDVLASAQPALHFADNAVEEYVTEGRDWLLAFEFVDATGALIDFEAMGVTAVCVVYPPTDADGNPSRGTGLATPILQAPELTVTIDGTLFAVTADAADTAGLAAGQSRRACPWRLTLTHTASSRSCDVFGVRHSTLVIQGDD